MLKALAIAALFASSHTAVGIPPTDTITRDVAYVAAEAAVAAPVLRELVRRESGERPEAIRYCKQWKGKRCAKERSCYTRCPARPEVWKNRLDVGLWQLRDAPTWSWRRWYNREHGPVPETCLVEHECARRVMVAAVLHMKRQASRSRWKCRTPPVEGYEWMSLWNGCRSFSKYRKFILKHNL